MRRATSDVRQSISDGLAELRPYIDEWDDFVDACALPLPTVAWAHPGRTTPAELADLLTGCGIRTTPVAWADGVLRLDPASGAGSTFPFLAGLCHVQEEVSILAADVLGVKPGERVLDLCAAPGGKTARIALCGMRNAGTVVANDRSPGRLKALRGNLDRLGVINTSVTQFDATGYPPGAGSFDRVLVDAPCSGTGTVRKHPEALDASSAGALAAMPGLQKAILRRAIALLKPGGTLLYSTCTFSPLENEVVVHETLAEHPELRLEPIMVQQFEMAPGLTSFGGRDFDPTLADTRRIYPHQNDTGGFFLARMTKHA